MSTLGRIGSAGCHDGLDLRDDLVYGLNGINESLGLIERYVRGDVCCHVHIDLLITGQSGPEQFCAEFRSLNNADFMITLEPLNVGGRDHEDTQVDLPVNLSGHDGDWREQLVFVGVREIPESPQQSTAIRSAVRLKSLDDCLVIPMEFSEPSTRIAGTSLGAATVEGGHLVFDGKLHSALDFHPALGIFHGELKREMIEAAPEIMEAIAELQSARLERRRKAIGNLTHVHNMIAGFRLQLYPKTWVASFVTDSRLDQRIEFVSVMLCPSDLGSTTSEIRNVHGVESPHEERQERKHQDTAHEEWRGDSRPEAQRVHAELEEGGEGVTGSPPEEVTSRTSPDHRNGGCTSKRTHSGSPEDA